MSKPAGTAYLVIAHGTREEEGKEAFFRFVEELRASLPGRRVEPAFLELCRPSIPEGIEACIRGGAGEIVILPLMLFPGRHINQDIPAAIQAAKREHPQVDFHYAGALALAGRKPGKRFELKMFELLLSKLADLEGVTQKI
jgi:sirohydrochlorin ferrochelatase